MLNWIRVDDEILDAPFLQQDLSRLATRTELRLTPLSALKDLDLVTPGAFIFHHSRCGSNLFARSFSAASGWAAYSEPRIINQALAFGLEKDAIRGLLSALVSRGGAIDSPGIIKLSGWNLLFAKVLRHACPNVPSLAVFRDPQATLLSLYRRPPIWAKEPLSKTKWVRKILDDKFATELDHREQIAILLASLLTAEIPANDWTPRLIHYPDIPSEIRKLASYLTGRPMHTTQQTALEDSLARDSHQPSLAYEKSRERPVIPDDLRLLHRQHTRAAYDQLLNATGLQAPLVTPGIPPASG